MITLGFIGTGHMGASLALVISKDPNYRLLLLNRTASKAEKLQQEIGERAFLSNVEEIAKEADFIFLGVKPKDMDEALKLLASYHPKGVLVSMAAGINMDELVSYLPNNPWIRIMPNTPVLIQEGMTLVLYHQVSQEDKARFEGIMSLTGRMLEIEEKDMDAASVLTGSAPAYVDYFIDALIEAGASLGLKKEDAEQYALSMAKGTVALALATGKAPKQLGKEVCSPGGSTIEGVNVLQERGLYEMVKDAANATFQKNKNMK